jgi:transcriptional regulator with XRE-family HTH domain
MNIFVEEVFKVSYRFREAREKAGLSAAEVGRRIGVSQPAVTQWETGAKVPSVEMLCKLADLYCVSTDYLLGRGEQLESIPLNDDILPPETLRILNGKPVWDESSGWGIVNGVQDYVIFMDGTRLILAEAMNLRAMVPAYIMGYSPAAKPLAYEDLHKHKSIWVKPISPDSFLQDELTGWYRVHEFYVQNEHGTQFLFDTYGTRWLAFEMEF